MKKRLKFLSFLGMIFLSFSIASCENPTANKSAPVYRGMMIQNNAQSNMRFLNEEENPEKDEDDLNDPEKDEDDLNDPEIDEDDLNDPEIETEIEDIVQIEIKNDDEIKYYVKPNEKFVLVVKLSNPSNFEIQSFTLNGKKYANYMFEKGSDMENLYLKVQAPADSGYTEYTIDAIKYIDGTDIKDVDLSKGEQTIKAGVKYENEPEAIKSNLKIYTNKISFDLEIKDPMKLLKNEIKAVLSDGKTVVSEKVINKGKNYIEFDNLIVDKKYQYGIFTSYDICDGNNVALRTLLKEDVKTLPAFKLDNVNATQDSVTFDIVKTSDVGEVLSVSLHDKDDDYKFVSKITDLVNLKFEGLKSNHNYTIKLAYKYLSNDKDVNDSILCNFSTKEKVEPKVELKITETTKTTIKFDISVEDIDSVYKLKKIEAYKQNQLFMSLEDLNATEFINLLSNTEYVIKVTYNYDLNDGKGLRTKIVEANAKTKAKVEPQVELKVVEETKSSIAFDISVEDIDSVYNLKKIELFKQNELVKTLESLNNKEFTNLLSNNEYVIKVSYNYDLNDGKGLQTKTVEANAKTKAKTEPKIEIENRQITDTEIIGDLRINDTDNILKISKVELYIGDKLISTNPNSKVYFNNLEAYTNYDLKITYEYDLNDGTGKHTKEYKETIKTNPFIEITNTKILNTSAVSEGETIYLQINLKNPSLAIPKFATINGLKYKLEKTTNPNLLYVEILNKGQFKGGDVELVVENICLELDDKEYCITPNANNVSNVFINGALTINRLYCMNENFEEVKWISSSFKSYLAIDLKNDTGYTVDSVVLNGHKIESFIKRSDDLYLIDINSTNSGLTTYSLTEISYSNPYISNTLNFEDLSTNVYYTIDNSVNYIDDYSDFKSLKANHYYELSNDIDFSNVDWSNQKAFSGVINGKNYKITNMSSVGTKTNIDFNYGLFSSFDGIFVNTNFTDSIVLLTVKSTEEGKEYNSNMGIISYGSVNGLIDNCTFSNIDIKVNNESGETKIGVISSINHGQINNCIIKNISIDVFGHKNYIGGVTYSNYGEIKNCYVDAFIKSDGDYHNGMSCFGQCGIGGITCANDSTGKINYCFVKVTLKGGHMNHVGGITASNIGFITKNVSKSNIEVSNITYIGSICGSTWGKGLVNNNYSYTSEGKQPLVNTYSPADAKDNYSVDDMTYQEFIDLIQNNNNN